MVLSINLETDLLHLITLAICTYLTCIKIGMYPYLLTKICLHSYMPYKSEVLFHHIACSYLEFIPNHLPNSYLYPTPVDSI